MKLWLASVLLRLALRLDPGQPFLSAKSSISVDLQRGINNRWVVQVVFHDRGPASDFYGWALQESLAGF